MVFVFFGTDEFSVKVLDTLKERGLTPALIVTVPDKPKGRKMVLTPPLTKGWGEKDGVEVNQNSGAELLSPRSSAPEFDFFLVASYGKIIPQEILDIPTHGTLNIHPSLLSKYRGPSPLETAILNGDQETGVTIIKLDAEMDHGPILAQESLDLRSGQEIELNDKYNFEQLRDKLAVLGAELLVKTLPNYLAKKITLKEQGHNQATYTKKFTKTDGCLGLQDPPLANYRKILALNPWPGTYLDYPGPTGKIRVIVKQAHFEDDKLIYDCVVPAGRREMSWTDFLRGLDFSFKPNLS